MMVLVSLKLDLTRTAIESVNVKNEIV